MNKDNWVSLKKRYFIKLSNNLIGFPISLVTHAIIPRGLGPKAYGDFIFLNNFFTQVVGFLDMGTSDCFYTKLSQRPKEFGLISFYLYFVGIVSLIVIGFVSFALLTPVHIKVWLGQKIFYIYLAAGLAIITWIAELFNKMNDAYSLTFRAEMAKILQRFLGVILIVLLYVFHRLDLTSFFFYQYLILFFLIVAFIWIIKRFYFNFAQDWKLSFKQIKNYTNEFYHFTHPLFLYSLVGLIVGILDRWFLQRFGGSIQQGLFGLSYQIATICFLFTGAMTPLLMREFCINFANKDLNRMATLFNRYIPLFYSITAYLACFVAIHASKVIYIIGGNKYSDAVVPLTIMAFFPIHSTYGQLSSSVFYATGQTRLYRNIGIISMLLGLPIAYFLIAPKEQFGIGAGATGLAIKMIVLQFIEVNIQLYFNAKFLKFSFWKYIGHQMFIVLYFCIFAFITSFITNYIIGFQKKIIPSFILAGILYTVIVLCFIYFYPTFFGLEKQEIKLIKEFLMKKLTLIL